MRLSAIGPYQIERELGHGGMGEVYLARDTRLDRQVAIKALPAHLAADPDRLARFQREAKVLASLNHPGIGAIYGLEEAEGHRYLVLEYIEGETLADRLANGPISVEESLSLARQIAEALEAAHEKGVIHRDLKPGNVMVTPESVAKVLDFGLARTADGPPSSTHLPQAPPAAERTLTSPAVVPAPVHSPTIPGAIMGTAGYMSPEQARGKAVDKRSDIFSFGCVLYEMLTGSGPFPGETVTDSLGAILHREPDWTAVPAGTPARVRELLRNCLAKERRNRLHDIGDARLEIERAIAGHEWVQAGAQRPAKSSPVRWAAAGIACAVLAGAGWLAGRAAAPGAPTGPAQAFHVSATVAAKPDLSAVVGISPDARFVVYKANPRLEADSTKPGGVLVVRRLDRDETRVIEGTEGIEDAALSADGRWLAFAAAKDRTRSRVTLKKLAIEDGRPVGTPESLCDLQGGGGMSVCWSSDREIVIAQGWQQTILAVPASGGEPRVVLKEEQGKEIDNWGMVRPLVAGKSILASRWALVGQSIKERTEVVDLATGKRLPLIANAGAAQLVGGEFVVARRNQGTLIAAKIDLSAPAIVGEPVTVWSGRGLGDGVFASASGTIAMTTSSGEISGRRLMWIDEQGLPQPVGAPARAYGRISVSPEGGRVAVFLDSSDESDLGRDLWIHDLSRRTFSRLATQGPAWEFVWSRDGRRLAYSSVTKDEFSIWERRADGTGEPVKIYASPGPQIMAWPTDWSPDGKVLAIMQVDLAKDAVDVLMLEQEAGASLWRARPYLNSPAAEGALRFSADGKWVRFATNETGNDELYVQRFTGAGAGEEDAKSGRRQISTNGANGSGWWSPDGKELRYVDNDGRIMSVQVQAEPSFSASVPKVLASYKDLKTRDHSWAPDGRLMVVLQGESERAARIDLIVNFVDELRAKMKSAR